MKKTNCRPEDNRLIFISIFVLLYGVATGQSPGQESFINAREMYFSHLTRENGLPSDFVMHAIQDFRGYVWIATDNGLARYDGKNVTVFQNHVGKHNSIVDNYVIILKETRDSMLWIGTRNGISIYNPFTGMFRNFPYDQGGQGTFPGRFVRSFFEDADGCMWIATNDGLIYSLKGSDKFVHVKIYWPSEHKNKESEFNFLTSIVADPRDHSNLFLGTLGGILCFDKHRGVVVESFPKEIRGRTSVYEMYIDDKEHLWSCGWFTGLNCYDLKTGRWQEFPYNRKSPLTIISIYPKGGDEFWLSTVGMGLGIFNKKKGTFRFIRYDPLKPRSIISDNVNHTAFFNSKNDLWVTGSEGISIENKKIFSFRENRPPFEFTALADVYRDKAAGRLYLGAYLCNGLFEFNEQRAKWSLIPEAKPGKHLSLLINSFYKDKRGILWLSTNKNLMFLDTISNKIRLYTTPDGLALQIHDAQINTLFEDPGENLWVGTRSDGLIRIDSSRTTVDYYKHQSGNPYSLVDGTNHRAFISDKFNRVWISNQEGVSIYEPGKDRFLNFFTDTLRKYGYGNRLVYNIEKDTLGRIWMTIDGLGLLRVEIKDNMRYSLKLFEPAHGLDASSISTMRMDSEGDFWINNVSLVHFNPYTEVFKLYDTQNGLHYMLSIGQKIYIDPDLNIFIPTDSGFEVKNKHSLEPTYGFRNLVIESMEINGNRTNLGYCRNGSNVVSLTADQNNVTFFFTAICFDDVSNIKYRYKLAGYDQDWYLSENTREARYSHLPPGKFEFNFNVINHPVLEDRENHMLLQIRPYFWQTWWFICSLTFIILTLSYITYHYRIRQLLRLERLRMRIATDLHDDVGSTLSSIAILSEMVSQKAMDSHSVKMLKTIGESSTQMMEKLDDIVWVVNPSNDKFQDLGLRISEYANPLCESKKIGFIVTFDEELTGLRLPMEIRRNVYLIAKEAINNAVKYAGCSEVRMHFKQEHGGLYMEISDDGKGFDTELPTTRNGLRNMRLRASQIKALIEISSAAGIGTRITLLLKTLRPNSNTV